MSWIRWTLPALLWVAVAPALAHSKKLPYPDAEALERVSKLYHEIFADDLKHAQTPAARSKLAHFLSQQVRENRDVPAQWVFVLEETIRLAAQGGEIYLALSTLDDLDKAFVIPLQERKIKVLATAASEAPNPETAKVLVDLVLGMIQEALDANQFDQAVVLAGIAQKAADRTAMEAVKTQVQQRRLWVEAIHRGALRLKDAAQTLKQNPSDPEANLHAALFYGPLRGQWDKAIPLFLRGKNAALRELALRDQAQPSNAADQLALANGWWELARSESDPVFAWGLQARAAHWYDQALAQLAGLHRTMALRRIDAVQQRSLGFLRTLSLPLQVGEIKKWEAGSDQLKAVVMTADGRHIVSAGMDKLVRVWEVSGAKEERALSGHTNQIYGLAMHPVQRVVFSSSWDRLAIAWDLRNGNELRRFTHDKDVNGCALSRDGSRLVTGCDDKNAYVWNTSTGKMQQTLQGHGGFVLAVAMSPNDRFIATGSNDRLAKVWNADTGEVLATFPQHTASITALAFTPDSRFVASCGDETPRLWEAATGREVQKFVGHDRMVTTLAIAPDGRRLLTGGDDGTVRLWDLATGKQLHRFDGHTDYVTGVRFARDGLHAVSCSRDRTIRLWGLPVR